MPQTKSSSSNSKRQAGRRSDPKLFRCTGFGNCDMVFTRSEHLARHARKHTGEVKKKKLIYQLIYTNQYNRNHFDVLYLTVIECLVDLII